MKNNIALAIVSLLLSAGCGDMYAQANTAPQVGPQRDMIGREFAPARRPLLGACPPGTPRMHCRLLANDIGPGLAIMVARVDNVPIPIFPYGGRLPLPRLLPGERTQFVLPTCTRRDQYGSCVHKMVVEAYEVTDATVDPQLIDPSLAVIPVVTEDTRHCYEVEFDMPADGRMLDLPAVSVQYWNSRRCPSRMVPTGREEVVDSDD